MSTRRKANQAGVFSHLDLGPARLGAERPA